VLTLVAVLLTAALIPSGNAVFGTAPAPLDSIPITPLSAMVLVSMFGGIWTFLVRFRQAGRDVRAMDAADPLPQSGDGA